MAKLIFHPELIPDKAAFSALCPFGAIEVHGDAMRAHRRLQNVRPVREKRPRRGRGNGAGRSRAPGGQKRLAGHPGLCGSCGRRAAPRNL